MMEGDSGAVAPDTGGDTSGGGEPSAPSTPTHDPARATSVKIDTGDGGGDDGSGGVPRQKPANDNAKPIKAKLPFGDDDEAEFESVDQLLEQLTADSRKYKFKIGDQQKAFDRHELQRMVELGTGAYDKMREAAEMRKSVEAALERARKGGDDLAWYLQEQVGVNPMEWAQQTVWSEMQKAQEIEQLRQQNPALAEMKLREQAEAKARAEYESKAKAAERERQRAEAQKSREEFMAQVPSFLGDAGVPHNPATEHMFFSTGQKYANVGHELPPHQVAQMVAQEFSGMVSGHIKGMDDAALLEFLGPDVRKRLRELEKKALGGKAQPQRAAQDKPAESKPKGGDVVRPTLRQWAARYGEK